MITGISGSGTPIASQCIRDLWRQLPAFLTQVSCPEPLTSIVSARTRWWGSGTAEFDHGISAADADARLASPGLCGNVRERIPFRHEWKCSRDGGPAKRADHVK